MKPVFAEKKLLLFIIINFIVGAFMGTILFYAQLNAGKINPQLTEASFTTQITPIEIFSLAYTNALWLIAIFIAHRIIPTEVFHPIIILRGATVSFSVSYIINYMGIMESLCAVLPQCFSILPVMVFFSYKIVQKRKEMLLMGKETFEVKRKSIFFTMLLALVAALIESLLFLIFCEYLL